jgi:hypothetical protein
MSHCVIIGYRIMLHPCVPLMSSASLHLEVMVLSGSARQSRTRCFLRQASFATQAKFPIVALREYLGAFCTDSASHAGGLLAIGLKPPPRVQSLGASLRVGERDGARCRLRVGFWFRPLAL